MFFLRTGPKATAGTGKHVGRVQLRDAERSKLNSRWRGPVEVSGNPRFDTYNVEVSEGALTVNADRLKPYFPPFEGPGVPYDWIKPKESPHIPEHNVDQVENILWHGAGPDGTLRWRVKWKGSDDTTLERASSFVPSYNVVWADYNREHNIKVDYETIIPDL
jgi:hypothetical protein